MFDFVTTKVLHDPDAIIYVDDVACPMVLVIVVKYLSLWKIALNYLNLLKVVELTVPLVMVMLVSILFLNHQNVLELMKFDDVIVQ